MFVWENKIIVDSQNCEIIQVNYLSRTIYFMYNLNIGSLYKQAFNKTLFSINVIK